jgi:hypothetical protein
VISNSSIVEGGHFLRVFAKMNFYRADYQYNDKKHFPPRVVLTIGLKIKKVYYSTVTDFAVG